MDPAEDHRSQEPYERAITDLMAEFELPEDLATVIVGPDDEHYTDRIESFRTIAVRVHEAWEIAAIASDSAEDETDGPGPEIVERIKVPEVLDRNGLVRFWFQGMPQTASGANPAQSMLELWGSGPTGYVEVLRIAQDHLALVEK